jgi:predicted nucleotidyltransferase
MDRMNKKEIFLRTVEKTKKNNQHQKIIIFGSYTCEEWSTKDSDIDLFIIKRTKKNHLVRALQIECYLGMKIL